MGNAVHAVWRMLGTRGRGAACLCCAAQGAAAWSVA